jgi:quinohemoprotein ethanol dehydrogenase
LRARPGGADDLELDGKQYLSIAAGWGGVYGETNRATDHATPGTVHTFVIGGDAKYPNVASYKMGPLISGVKYDPKDANEGVAIYVSHCIICHGVPGGDRGGNIPNLGCVDADLIANLDRTVLRRQAADQSMPDFTGKLTLADLEKLMAFIQGTADAIRPK